MAKGIKTGGKKKGSVNKFTAARIEILESLVDEVGINPFKELLLIARDSGDEMLRLHALKEACKYLYAQKKAVEVTGVEDKGITIIVEDYLSKK